MLDLEILHWWTTRSVESFVDFESCIRLFRVQVVELAFTHPFLMHEILAISALHLSKVYPHRATVYHHASSTHLATALSLFQPEIANLSVSNCEACFAFSVFVFTHAWASQDPMKPSTLFFAPAKPVVEDNLDMVNAPQWVKLHRGSITVITKIFPSLKEGLMEPLFAPWKTLDPSAPFPLLPVEDEQLNALATAWTSASSLSQGQKDTLDATLISTRRIFSMLAYNPTISRMSAVMSWFSALQDDFVKMLEDKIPEALLIVVFYCVALKRSEHMWWVYEKAENLLRTVLDVLGSGWERWTAWPILQVLGEKVEEHPRVEFSINNMLA
jgi:hypothetical protein